MLESLQSIFDAPFFDEPWKPVSRAALAAWLTFYVAFLAYAFSAHGGFLFIDSANLVVHEGGHNLFDWFGPTLGLWGGTLLQWLVPFLLAVYFFTERQTTGFVFYDLQRSSASAAACNCPRPPSISTRLGIGFFSS